MHAFFRLIGSLTLTLALSPAVWALQAPQPKTTSGQAFEDAIQALQKNNYPAFDAAVASLQNHPLSTYLTYRRLSRELTKTDESTLVRFFNQHPDLMITRQLKAQWLDLLASQKKWSTFRAHADKTLIAGRTQLQCHDLRSELIQTKKLTASSRKLAQTLWSEQITLPFACSAVSKYLEKKTLISQAMAWEKIRLALQANQFKNATKIANAHLNAKNQPLFKQWSAWIGDPKKHLKSKNKPWITPLGNQFTVIGLQRLMRQDLQLAIDNAAYFTDRMKRSPELILSFQESLIKQAFLKGHPKASDLLAKAKTQHPDLLDLQLKAALREKDWPRVQHTTSQLLKASPEQEGYLYWLARSLEAQGVTSRAQVIYQSLAKQRDFYGFLAADKLNLPYAFNDNPISLSQQTNWANFSRLYPSLALIKALREVDYSQTARSEWTHLLDSVDEDMQKRLGRLASQQGWNDLAIIALGKAKYWDDLEVRYPLAHRELVESHAQASAISEAWIYGIMRQESIFQEDAKSRVGALGLMQLMPKTAKHVAKELNLEHPSQKELMRAPTNIQLGSHYLKSVLEKFGGNQALATAAYNAGPSRVAKWLPDQQQDADIWIETIPFSETRKYVKAVLENQVVFEWRMQGRYTRLSERLPYVSVEANLQQIQLP
jgi:soluble lytic murein transglycosylase